MPANVTVEYVKAQEKYLNAKTREEKITALEEMIREAPSHKGGENLRKQLKQRLAKLKQQKKAKASRKSLMIPKEGDAQVCILGLTQSGKSTLLSKLTNARPKISDHPFTTTKPKIGTFDFEGVKIQLIEVPSSFKPVFMSIVQSSDGMVLIYRSEDELKELKNVLSSSRIKKPFVEIKRDEDLPIAIKHVPTTTMNIHHDGKRIIKFRQNVQGKEDLIWMPEQIKSSFP